MASSSSNINGGWIKFRNKRCNRCGRRATLRISESTENPQKLYYYCESDRCKRFIGFWEPETEDVNMQESQQQSPTHPHEFYFGDQQMQGQFNDLQREVRALQMRVQNLESYQGGMKLMMVLNMLFFGISMSLFVMAMLLFKSNRFWVMM
uniref:Zinc finger GRF-type domain-containing protein n=1 Tax=Davidia involucrata TaxID=16924 RepID=A0A5B6YMZ9_DAVIN